MEKGPTTTRMPLEGTDGFEHGQVRHASRDGPVGWGAGIQGETRGEGEGAKEKRRLRISDNSHDDRRAGTMNVTWAMNDDKTEHTRRDRQTSQGE